MINHHVDDTPFSPEDLMHDTSGAMAEIVKHCKGSGQRLGQFFCNYFVKETWPELYHEKDTGKAKAMIREWLTRHQYFDKAPPRIL